MNTNISTIQKIEAYLKQRFNLSDEILNDIASEIYIANHTQGKIKIRYLKKTDTISTNRWSFCVSGWLRNNYKQCACCGAWYRENLAGQAIFSTAIVTVYSASKGREVELPVCNVCLAAHDVCEIISDTMCAFDSGYVSYAEAFKPVTHVKGIK